jgi:hypothetical protein
MRTTTVLYPSLDPRIYLFSSQENYRSYTHMSDVLIERQVKCIKHKKQKKNAQPPSSTTTTTNTTEAATR